MKKIFIAASALILLPLLGGPAHAKHRHRMGKSCDRVVNELLKGKSGATVARQLHVSRGYVRQCAATGSSSSESSESSPPMGNESPESSQ